MKEQSQVGTRSLALTVKDCFRIESFYIENFRIENFSIENFCIENFCMENFCMENFCIGGITNRIKCAVKPGF
jgi:hypothetical protein